MTSRKSGIRMLQSLEYTRISQTLCLLQDGVDAAFHRISEDQVDIHQSLRLGLADVAQVIRDTSRLDRIAIKVRMSRLAMQKFHPFH
jgi:hypothetical protein